MLNRKTDYYPKLKQILVYPSAFIVHQNRTDIAGVYSTQRNVLLGESWEYGKVVLSWNSTVEGAADPFDGSNVVIHEFAHQLDQEDGSANGAPPLRDITSAEFFAVISETFFERPIEFYQQHNQLYKELSQFYQLDPINWH